MAGAITILDHGRPVTLDYPALLAYHGGGAVAGAAIGFRAMELAAAALSRGHPWDRKDLAVASWHDGPGIRDAIEFVTRAVTRQRFELRADAGASPCAPLGQFRFEVRDGAQTVAMALRARVLPDRFFELAGQVQRSVEQQGELERLKAEVAARVMGQLLESLFASEIKVIGDA